MESKYKLKESSYILKETEDVYQVIFTATRKIKRISVDSLVRDMIINLERGQSYSDLRKSLERYSSVDVRSCLNTLESEGIVRQYTSEKTGRYSRQLLFIDELTDSWEETLRLQKKID
jgi:uncharacterized FlgJ-related protein